MCSAEITNHSDTDAKPAGKKLDTTAGIKRPICQQAAEKTDAAKSCSKITEVAASREKPVRDPVVLDSQLEIKNIGSLVEQLLPLLSRDGSVVIDAAKVESVDSAALQVLVAFANSARARALALEWRGTTSVLKEFSELADLDRYLDFRVAPVEVQDDGLCPVF